MTVFNSCFLITVLIILYIIGIMLGYIAGKINKDSVIQYEKLDPQSIIKNNKNINQHNMEVLEKVKFIQIDDSKYVTDVDYDGIEKKFSTLGDESKKEQNIQNSIDKLSNIIKK